MKNLWHGRPARVFTGRTPVSQRSGWVLQRAVKGNLFIGGCLELNGVAKVNYSTDTMRFGDPGFCVLGSPLCQGPKITGSGKIKVSSGMMKILVVNLNEDTTPRWEISGGTLQVGEDSSGACTCDDTRVGIDMTGGTLNFKTNFTARHGIEATGGTLIKKANKTVTFR